MESPITKNHSDLLNSDEFKAMMGKFSLNIQ